MNDQTFSLGPGRVIVISVLGEVDSVYGSTRAMREDGEVLWPLAAMIESGAISGSRGGIKFRLMRVR